MWDQKFTPPEEEEDEGGYNVAEDMAEGGDGSDDLTDYAEPDIVDGSDE